MPVAIAMGGESTHPRGARSRLRARIHLKLDLRFRHVEASGRCEGVFAGIFSATARWPMASRVAPAVISRELGARQARARSARRRRGRGSSRCRPRRASRRRRAGRARERRAARRPSRRSGSRRARRRRRPGRARRRGSRARRARRCRRRARGRARGRGASRGRASAIARSVLISETASAPPSSRGARAGGDVGGVGRELDDQRLARGGRTARTTRSSATGSAPMSRPVSTFGQETLSSIAAISARSSQRSEQARDLAGGRAHDVRDQRRRGTPRAASAIPGSSCVEVALEALVGQADRVDQSGRAPPTAAAAGCRRAAAA